MNCHAEERSNEASGVGPFTPPQTLRFAQSDIVSFILKWH